MNAAVMAVRVLGAVIFTATAAFLAWLSTLPLRHMFDPGADNSAGAYFLVGAPIAILALMCLGLAWAAARGERARFAQVAAVALGFTFLVLMAGILR